MDIFPIGLLGPDSVRWRRGNVTLGGGVSEGGLERLAVTDGGGKWICEMAVPLLSVAQIKAARAIVEGCDGGVAPLLVPYFQDAEGPWPGGVAPEDASHGDGTAFGDGSDYVSGPVAVTLAAAALRATVVTPTLTVCGDLIGGEVFSIDHPARGQHIYQIIRVNGDGTVAIRPPLREAVTDGTVANFNMPVCQMTLTNSEDAVAAVTPPYLSKLTLVFREAF